MSESAIAELRTEIENWKHSVQELDAKLTRQEEANEALKKAHKWLDGRKALVNCVPLAEIIEDGLSKLEDA